MATGAFIVMYLRSNHISAFMSLIPLCTLSTTISCENPDPADTQAETGSSDDASSVDASSDSANPSHVSDDPSTREESTTTATGDSSEASSQSSQSSSDSLDDESSDDDTSSTTDDDSETDTGTDAEHFRLYIGSGAWSGSTPGAISVLDYEQSTNTITTTYQVEAGGLASYLQRSADDRYIYAVDERYGGVLSFSVDPSTGKPEHIGHAENDTKPVFLALAPDAPYLLAANYGDGSIELYPIEDGIARAPSQRLASGMQAHSVAIDDDGMTYVANAGSDEISHFHFDAGELSARGPSTAHDGGPRHLRWLPDGRLVAISERADTLTAYTRNAQGMLERDWQVPRLPKADTDQSEMHPGAEIRATGSGDFLFASNRGESNSIVAYDLRQSPPQLIAHYDTRGQTPRSFSLSPNDDFLVVAHHGDNLLSVFDIEADGALTFVTSQSLEVAAFFVDVVAPPSK